MDPILKGTVMSNSEPQLGLSQLINQVKAELVDSQKESIKSGNPPMFRIKRVEVEVRFTVREVAKADGGIDLKLVALKAGEEAESTHIHSVTVEMLGIDSVDFGLLQEKVESQ